MRIFRLIYCSRAKKVLSFDDVKVLAKEAKSNNEAKGISGILLYTNNHFLQSIEGSQEEVNALYLKISQDQRHGSVKLLYYEQVNERLFPSWNMGLVQTEPSQDLINRYFEHCKFVPNLLSPSQAENFLYELKEMFF